MELPLKRKRDDKVIDYYQFQSEMKIDPDEDNNLRTRTEINVQMPKPIGKKYTHLACRKLIFNRPLHWDFAIEGKCVVDGDGEIYYTPNCCGYQYQPVISSTYCITITSDEEVESTLIQDTAPSGTTIDALKEKLGPYPWWAVMGKNKGIIKRSGTDGVNIFQFQANTLGTLSDRLTKKEFKFKIGEIGCFVADNNTVLEKNSECKGVIYMDRAKFVKSVLIQLLANVQNSYPTDLTVGELLKCLAWLPKHTIAVDGDGDRYSRYEFAINPSQDWLTPDRRNIKYDGQINATATQPTFGFVDATLASILGWNAFSGPVNRVEVINPSTEDTLSAELSASGKQDFYILSDPHVFDMTMKYPSYKSPIEQVLITCQDLNLNAKNIPVVISQDYSGYCPSVASFTPIHTTSTSFFTDRMLVNNDSFQVGEIISCDIPEDTTSFKFYVKFKDATGRLRDLWLAPGENVTIELAFW